MGAGVVWPRLGPTCELEKITDLLCTDSVKQKEETQQHGLYKHLMREKVGGILKLEEKTQIRVHTRTHGHEAGKPIRDARVRNF